MKCLSRKFLTKVSKTEMWNKIWARILILLLVLTLGVPCFAEANPPAYITFSTDGVHFHKPPNKVYDHNVMTAERYEAGTSLWFKINCESKMYIYIAWMEPPHDLTATVQNKDGTTETVKIEEYYNTLTPVDSNTDIVRLDFKEKAEIATLDMYKTKSKATNYHPWEFADKLDYMIVCTHPDDDVLFLGAVAPTLENMGYRGTSITTCTKGQRRRINEGLNGSWTLGIRIHPIMGNFPDGRRETFEMKQSFNMDKLTEYYVKMFRKYKPEVVITQDTNGEYGHWQHKVVSAAVEKAVKICNDPNVYPESAEMYGAWEVKKLYKHLETKNPIKIKVNVELENIQGKTALKLAKVAFLCHGSQQGGVHKVKNEGKYDLTKFGMTWGVVDSGKTFFDNLPATDESRNRHAMASLVKDVMNSKARRSVG